MPKTLTYSEVVDYLYSLDIAIISTDYKNNKSPLKLNCLKCGEVYAQSLDRISRGFIHPNCVYSSYRDGRKFKNGKMMITHNCEECCKIFYTPRSNSKFCNRKCAAIYHSKKGTCAKNGSKGGKLSTTKFRSKNEIYLFELCENEWGCELVKPNQSMFNGFDTDIVLFNHKIAIEWNGKWHYQKVREGHNFKQTQIRDRIKSKAVRGMNYNLIVFKDMGSFNKSRVELCFEKLKTIISNNLLSSLSNSEYLEIDINTRDYNILNAGSIKNTDQTVCLTKANANAINTITDEKTKVVKSITEKDILEQYLKDGYSYRRIGKLMKLSNNAIKRKCKKYGISQLNTNIQKSVDISYDDLFRLVQIDKLPFTTIGKMYHISDNAIRKKCKKMNIPLKR